MIGGFIVQGTAAKRVIVRAIGPELTQYGVPNPLADPTLELHNHTGALIAHNDNWMTTILGGIITSDQVQDITGQRPCSNRPKGVGDCRYITTRSLHRDCAGREQHPRGWSGGSVRSGIIFQTLMKKESTSQSARALIALLVCGAACSIITRTSALRAGKLAFAYDAKRQQEFPIPQSPD